MQLYSLTSFFFFFNDTATTEIYTLSLHDALPISSDMASVQKSRISRPRPLLQSMHRRDPRDGNAGSTRSPRAEQMPCFLQPAGVEIGLQQGELDQVVLRAAAANAFVFPVERGKRLD